MLALYLFALNLSFPLRGSKDIFLETEWFNDDSYYLEATRSQLVENVKEKTSQILKEHDFVPSHRVREQAFCSEIVITAFLSILVALRLFLSGNGQEQDYLRLGSNIFLGD
jgi:hypothetical protein